MKTMNGVMGISAVVLGVFAVACGGSGGDDGSTGGAAAISAGPAASATATAKAIPTGSYVLDNSDVGATLTIKSATATSVSYSIGILGKSGSEHNGELDDRTAKASGASFVDTVDPDCSISLQASGTDSVQVKQTGSCSDAGFGAFLDGSGTYKKSAGLVGLYEMETTHRAWAIRVTSENPVTFHIFAGHLEDASERVDAKDLVAQPNGNGLLFEHGPNCSIELAKTDTGLHVTQTGTCDEIGFPSNDDLSMSDDSGADFSRIDETKECFDTQELAVGATANACKSPL